jgi:glycosyltransferase involved in cell wall biosynthesis
MRIAFTVLGNSRRSNYLNGDTIRYGNGGGSGTDTSSIVIAEYLSKVGHDVVFAQEELEPQLKKDYEEKGIFFNPGKKVRGVYYTNFQFDGIENKEFDILVNSLWFEKYKELPIKITKAVIYWSHMQWIYGIDSMIDYVSENNLALGFVNISNWEKQMNSGTLNRALQLHSNTKTTLIPNPIMDDMILEVIREYPVRKPHKFVFHAAWARGGNVAVEAVRQLPFDDKEFHAFDYLLATHDHRDEFFNRHNGVDKKTLFTNIAESEYFIYPLYTPYQDVHKDTFSCVVAEAIALGAIVITYPLGALPEYFNEYCVWIDFPDGVEQEKMQQESLTKDMEGKFKATNSIIDKINYLENNPSIKKTIREKGREYILSSFNSEKVGQMWVDFINELV